MRPSRPALLFSLLLVACDAAPPESASERTVRLDSAGIEVVRSAAPVRDSVVPALGETVLALTGAGHEFYSVADVVPFDSLLIVAERTRVRAFRPDATLAWEFGGEGEGPREFLNITDVELRGDSIALLDLRTRRVTLVTRDGEWVRVLPLPPSVPLGPDLVPVTHAAFGLVSSPGLFDPDGPQGLVRTPQVLLAVDWADGSSSEIASLLGQDGIVVHQGQGITNFRPLFGRGSLVFELPYGIGVAEAVHLGFDDYSPTGELRRRVSAETDLLLTEDRVEAEWEARATILPGPSLQQLRDRSPVPDSVPAADAVMATPAGEVWLRRAIGEYRRFTGPGPHTWNVFAPDGTWTGAVSIPIDFTVTAITDDHVYGVRRDDLDVEHPEVRRRN